MVPGEADTPGRERETQPAGYTGDIPAEDCQGGPVRRDPGCIIPEGRGLIRMQRMIKKIILSILLSVISCTAEAAFSLTSKEMVYKINIDVRKPVCKLEGIKPGNSPYPYSIDFGEFAALDVVTGSVNGTVDLHFTDCEGVSGMKIKFSSVDAGTIPITNNAIPNRSENTSGNDPMAKGIMIKLKNGSDGREIDLSQGLKIESLSSSDYTLKLGATVVPENLAVKAITPGLVNTAVHMEISYN